jgi:isopentenyldiphosphate isomerase
MNLEPIEVRTADGVPTGIVKSRDAIHRDGDWHLAAFVWIFDGAGRILLQRRSLEKDVWPGRWDASCAGHVDAGEDATAAACRELGEELGLEQDDLAASLIAGEAHREDRSHLALIDREHHAVFFLRCEQPLEAYRPGPEVTALAFVPPEALERWARGDESPVEVHTVDSSLQLTYATDVVPYEPDYLLRIARTVRELCVQVSF